MSEIKSTSDFEYLIGKVISLCDHSTEEYYIITNIISYGCSDNNLRCKCVKIGFYGGVVNIGSDDYDMINMTDIDKHLVSPEEFYEQFRKATDMVKSKIDNLLK